MDDRLGRVLDRLDQVRACGTGHSARCPAHDDKAPSLQVSQGEHGGIVLHCHAGCEPNAVVKAIGLSMSDLAGEPYLVEEYAYTDVHGAETLYVVERWANPKTFRCRPGLPPPADRVLYALPWVQHARESGQAVYVVEGEKDANRLISCQVPVPATCNPGGAGKWLPQYNDQLAGCHVVVVADNDDTGKQHARAVAAQLAGHAASIALAVPSFGKDVSEMLDAGYSLDALDPLPEIGALPTLRSSTVRLRKVSWAWPGFIPRGKLTTIEGDPGDGKSTLTVDLAARWSTGRVMPHATSSTGPYSVIMISAEDDPEDTIAPRLRAAGADMDRVYLLSSGTDPNRPFDLGSDLDSLEQAVKDLGEKVIVVLDPLASFLPDDADAHSDHKIRRALYPLHLMARRTGAAVIAVRHLSKSATKAIYAGNGSIGIVAAARAAFLVRPHPDDEQARLFAPIKANLAAKPATLGYRIEWDTVHDVGRVVWMDEPVEMSAQDLMDGGRDADEQTALEEARDYLAEITNGMPFKWKEIIARGRVDGYAEHTLRRARNNVLKNVRNPILAGGERMDGSWWVRADQVTAFLAGSLTATESDGGACVPKDVGGGNHGHVGQVASATDHPEAASVTDSDEDREAALMQQPKVCDECGSEQAVIFAKPHWVIRCRAHDPRRWTAGGSS